MNKTAVETLFANHFVDGILDPNKEMLGPVKDGGSIIANTAPGCWGPMITPSIKGGHEVTKPVYVEGAEPGDAIAIRIQSITVTSQATASGNDQMLTGRCDGDGFVAAKCPQCGTMPSRPTPDSHNAGDFGSFLVGAPHDYTSTQEELETHRTDGHLDVNRVRTGAILICPVKVPGGGIYLGDMYAMQGDGEIAGHTTDVSGIAHLQVHVLKGLNIQGPILLPNVEDLPYTAKPFTSEERQSAQQIADNWNVAKIEESYPVSFIGSGPNLNDATENGLQRAADFFGASVPEIMNRATITGAIEIGRHPGVVTVTFLTPEPYLNKTGLLDLVKNQYR